MTVVDLATDILEITTVVPDDSSIESFEYHENVSKPSAGLNNGEAIQIDAQSQDIFTQPSNSKLRVDDRLAYTETTLVTLINNATPRTYSLRFGIRLTTTIQIT